MRFTISRENFFSIRYLWVMPPLARTVMMRLVLFTTLGACDPGYWLVNADGPAHAGVVRYSHTGYDLDAPAELHGLAGESWLSPGFAVSRFSDTARIEAASLYAKGRWHQPAPRPPDSLTFAPGAAVRYLGLEWRFPNQGVSGVVPDSCEFLVVVRVGGRRRTRSGSVIMRDSPKPGFASPMPNVRSARRGIMEAAAARRIFRFTLAGEPHGLACNMQQP